MPPPLSPITDNPEALQRFVEGMELYRSYLAGSRGDDIRKASQAFQQAVESDPSFHVASFYLAIALTELRDATRALERLEHLRDIRVPFLAEVNYHLAFAYSKTYQRYEDAENTLNAAQALAKTNGKRDLVVLIRATRIFLFSIIGGRKSDLTLEQRNDYLNRAIQGGEALLKELAATTAVGLDPETVAAARVETHNGMGIAYMRKGELAHEFNENQDSIWKTSEMLFHLALDEQPRNVRVLANLGTLRLLQGEQERKHGRAAPAGKLYEQAKDFYQKVLHINSYDQFPHYRLSWLCARTGDWDAASDYYETALTQHGAVPSKSYEQLRQAIEQQDVDLLPQER